MRDADFDKIAKALADPNRRRIFREIQRAQEMTCSEVCNCSALSQPTISHHIKTLEAAGLIKIRKAGQFHILTPNSDTLRDFADDVLAAPADPRSSVGKPRRAKAKA